MKTNIDTRYVWTEDGLRLQGVHYEPATKDLGVLFVHGMSGNFIENYFAPILGKTLSSADIGFVYAHNRGYSHINDIATKEITEDGGHKTVRQGVTYEKFADCIHDIHAWLNEIRDLGYKRLVLAGHSLGCNKVVYYFDQKKPKDIVGVVLASPPDLVGLAKLPKYQSSYQYNELLAGAKKNMANGEPRKLLSSLLWDWYRLSSQTFLDLFQEGNLSDNLPLLRNPEEFPQLASVNVPILALAGEHDDIVIRTLKEDLNLFKSKATDCPSFEKAIIPKANHNYERQEEEFAKVILQWIKKNFG